jgi:transposase
VPLALDDFEVASELVGGVLEVVVRSTFPACCYHCGSVGVVGHGGTVRRLRDRSCAHPTVLVWPQRRFRCRDCGRTSREQHREVAGGKRVTWRFLRSLGEAATSRPWSEVASAEGVSWWRVADAFDVLVADRLVVGGGRRLGCCPLMRAPSGDGSATTP